jgi:inner membrane protein
LPEVHTIAVEGFTANWRLPLFARAYPSTWTTATNAELLGAQARDSSFGVALVQPVDIYLQSERAVKYAFLFLVTTFVIAFVWEITSRAMIHPLQYLFIGCAMCVFYLLLVSLAERFGFDAAYVTASAPTVILIAGYWSWVLQGTARVMMGAALSGLYGYLYLLLRLEDLALLAGSIGLFGLLALVMFLTRRVNWYDLRGQTAAVAAQVTDPPATV